MTLSTRTRRRVSQAGTSPAVPNSVRIAELLAGSIETGNYRVGERLPTEAELASQFRVSRPSVREALSALQFTGYVISRRGFGSVVRSSSPGHEEPGPDTLDGVIDLLETRSVIEPAAVRAAASHPRPAALSELRHIITGMELAVEYPVLHPTTDLHLHLALVSVGRNPSLAATARGILSAHDGPVWADIRAQTWPSGDDIKTWLEDHRELASAVNEREPDRAEALARNHLAHVVGRVLHCANPAQRQQARLATLMAHLLSGSGPL